MSSSIREEAHRLIDRLPEGATWEDLMREIHAREAVEKGLSESLKNETMSVKEVRAKLAWTREGRMDMDGSCAP